MNKMLKKYIKQAWHSANNDSYPACAFAEDAARAFERELQQELISK